ncbi:hypothetical protein WG68_02440 [Arsukibacterium ikkense]|uniref:cyclic-guanylate-specific phosphodiesterase n=1 Tax=Arsukibacterium ikkense TaxID=336831 RepID=A0A0M2VCH2_9GAMM|nr:EAL domain-containing protein [Arsukibacterium ikkense]KKO46823.1 hypothetical protein WG68_02440 [Arsukibacterium ikkense]
MTSNRFRLNTLFSLSLCYSSLAIVMFAALLVLLNTVLFNDSATYRFIMLPDSALALLAAVLLLVAAITDRRYLLLIGLVVILLLAIAGLIWHLPAAVTDELSWLSGQNRLPKWQSIALLLFCVPWLGWLKAKPLSGQRVVLWLRLWANLGVIGLCLMVLLAQFPFIAEAFYSSSLAASAYMALYLIMLAIASICLTHIKRRTTTQHMPTHGWWLVGFIALGSVLLWFNFASQLQAEVRQTAHGLADRLQHSIAQAISEQQGLMYRLAERITAADTVLSSNYFDVEFNSYFRDYPYIDYLAVVGQDGVVLHAKAQNQTKLTWFNQYLQLQAVKFGVPQTLSQQPKLSLYYDSSIDHAFIIVGLPAANQAGVSQLVASVDTADALAELLFNVAPVGYFVRVEHPEQQRILYDSVISEPFTSKAGTYQLSLMAELHWRLKVFTNLQTQSRGTLATAEVSLLAGWLATVLAMLSQVLYQQSQRHRIRLLATNDKLRHNISELQRLQLQQQQIMNNSADMICVFDSKGRFVEISASCQHILGYRADELVGKAYIDFVHPDDKAISEKEASQIVDVGKLARGFRNRYIRKDGQVVHLMWNGNYVPSQGLMYLIARNFNDIVKAEQELRLFKRAVDATSNGVIIADLTKPDQPVSYVNAAFEKLTGYSAAEIIGQNCRVLQGAEPDYVAVNQMRHAIANRLECSVILKNYRKDKSLFWNQLFLAPVPDDSGQISHYIGIQTDMTGQKRYEQELAYNASHDLLTGLPNRALLEDRLTQSYQISQRNQQKVAILFIDLDGFKIINDSLGHLSGDEVLKLSCQRIGSCIRPGDTLARVGGDEFVLMLTDLRSVDEIPAVTERILAEVAKPMLISGQELHITASIGVSVSDNELTEPMHLVQQADLAMYRAKQLGRNNFQWYSSELELSSGKQLNLRVQLKKAIANEEFELYYQPQIDAISGDVVGVEALLRWLHPELGFISPEEFIPLAESTGEIVPLSNWVLSTASQYNQSLIERGIACVVMAVNVSSIQFGRANFVEHLQNTIVANDLDPRWFEIELTESLLFDNTEQVILKLQQLRALGVKISIDDFGTGYSSLSYLKRLPIDKLKIDRSFIRDIVSDKRDAAISKAIISLAHHLDIKVIAEGVENEAQAALLRKSLCDEFQGFYFAKPMPAAKLEQYLQNYQQNRLIRPEQVSGSKIILLVDDEDNILSALSRVLRREGYQILSCTSAMQAFEILALHQVQVIVSDQRMPGMSGTEFLSQVKDMYPDTIRMVLSGYTDLKSVTEAINKGAIYKFMTKPWQDDELRREIKKAFLQHQQQVNAKAENL